MPSLGFDEVGGNLVREVIRTVKTAVWRSLWSRPALVLKFEVTGFAANPTYVRMLASAYPPDGVHRALPPHIDHASTLRQRLATRDQA
jgi:hypothetical protein